MTKFKGTATPTPSALPVSRPPTRSAPIAAGLAVAIAAVSSALVMAERAVAQTPAPAIQQQSSSETYTDAAGHPLDAASVDRGRTYFRDRANCKYCHGWDGNGSLVEGQEPAPALTKTLLGHDDIVTTVAGGRPGTPMPTHLSTAWTSAYPCYGLTSADLAPGQMPPHPYGTLTIDEINDVATYVEAVYQGKMMTYDNCVAFFQRATAECQQYVPKGAG